MKAVVILIFLMLTLKSAHSDEIKHIYTEEVHHRERLVLDQELLKLLVETFIGNQDLENAYQVAKKGVELFPKDKFWLKTFGKVCIWLGRTGEAIDAYLSLYSLDKSKDIKTDLFNMSLIANRFDIAKWIIEEDFKQGEYTDLSDIYYIYYQAGDIQSFITILKNLYETVQNKKTCNDNVDIYLLKSLDKQKDKTCDDSAKIYLLKSLYKTTQDRKILFFLTKTLYETGKISEAEYYSKFLVEQPNVEISEVLLYSNILNSNKKFKESYKILKRFLPDFINYKQDNTLIEYLHLLSDLSWSTKDFETFVYVLSILSKLDSERLLDLIRAYLYYFQNKNYDIAVFYSNKGYKKFNSSFMLEGYIESLFSMGEYNEIVDFVEKNNIDIQQSRLVLYRYMASLLKTGKVEKAQSILFYTLSKKFDSQLFEDIVYTSIETNNVNLLKKILDKYKSLNKDLPIPFSLAYTFLQNGEKALESLYSLKYSESPSDLILYADVLSLYGRSLESEKIKFKLFRFFEDKLGSKNYGSLDQPEIELYLRLAMDFVDNRRFMELLEKYKTKISVQSYNDIYTSYQLKLENQVNVEFLIKKHGYKLRPWAYLNLALLADDRYLQNTLLEKYADILPIRDRVEALRRTGEINKAMEYGFKGLEENREDYLLYKQQRDLIVQNRPNYQFEFSHTERGKVEEITKSINISTYVSKGLYINFKYKDFDIKDFNKSVIVNVPNKTDIGLNVLKLTDSGNIKFGFGILKTLNSNHYVDVSYQRYIYNRYNITLYAGINTAADDTLFLMYGGMKDRYSVSMAYNFNNRLVYFVNPSLNYYYSSDKFSLGTSFNLYQQIFYKLRVGYPDYTFRFYTSHGIYKEKDGNKGSIKTLSPYQNIKVLPETFNQIGVGFSFGYDNDLSLVRVWRPFLSLDLNYTDTIGIGYGFSGGFGGALFRRDNMSFGFDYLKGMKGTTDRYLNIYLKYRHFY